MDALNPEVVVHSIVFTGGGLEISYQEARHRTDKGHRIQTIVIDPQAYEEDVIDLVATVQQIIDRYAVDERRPPDSIRGR